LNTPPTTSPVVRGTGFLDVAPDRRSARTSMLGSRTSTLGLRNATPGSRNVTRRARGARAARVRPLAGVALLLLSTLVSAASEAPGAAPPTFRLPAGARPVAYAARLTVVPGQPRVAAEIAIDVALDTPHDVLWLNADGLTVGAVGVDAPGTIVTAIGGHDQFLGLAFAPALPTGRHRVTIAYEAAQTRNAARGIFALEDAGAWYAMTQFEPLAARRAFPCFDEPAYKAPWQLTLRVPRGLVALSNTGVESQVDGPDGFTDVRFATTRPLSSYLVAFAVGPWETIDVGVHGTAATPTRIVVPRGRRADAGFVSRAYPELFRELETWFGIPYPFGKLDHVAIPLGVGFAMENAGLITYGTTGLLAPPGAEAPRFRHGAANVGAHEIAHQWFGNLVTTRWWDDIWLNEAFATWIAVKAVDAWHPEYDRGAGRVAERSEAIARDLLASARQIRAPVGARGDVYNAFDSITYEKGASVIGMFEGWLGEADFRRGVREYLASRADDSATASDFLAALSKASSRPVAPAFETFLDQNGVPQLTARLACDATGARLTLSQARLTLIGAAASSAQRWQIPACVRYGTPGAMREACTLVTEPTQALALRGGCPAVVFANARGAGYYVVDYGRDLLDRLARHRRALSTPELASLLRDLEANVRTGTVDAAQAARWVRLGAGSRDRHVVVAAIDLTHFLGDTVVDDAMRPAYDGFVRRVFAARARALGFRGRPGERDDDQLLRRALLRLVAPADPVLAATARRLAGAWLTDRAAVDPGIVDVVLMTAARNGDDALFERMRTAAMATQDRLERRNLLMALFAFRDPALAQRGLALLLEPTLDVRESWTALRFGNGWSPGRRAAHEFILRNFDALVATVDRDAPGHWPSYSAGLCSAADEVELAAFWRGRTERYAGAERELAEALESIRSCAQVRQRAGSPHFES
jgi:alanyl aminopeptidase